MPPVGSTPAPSRTVRDRASTRVSGSPVASADRSGHRSAAHAPAWLACPGGRATCLGPKAVLSRTAGVVWSGHFVRPQMSGSLAGQGRLRPCVARGRGSEQARERGECGGLYGQCGVQDSVMGDRDLVVRSRDWPAASPQ